MTASASAAAPAPAGLSAETDPLLEALHAVTRLHGRPVTPAALVAGIALEDRRLTPQSAIRAAENNGFVARVVKRGLTALPELLLPAILLLDDDSACVLVARKGRKELEVIPAEAGFTVRTVTVASIAQRYSGYALLVQPEFHPDQAGGAGVAGEVAPRSWFWGALWRFRGYYFEAALAGIMVNVLTVATALFIMNVYDRVVPNNAIDTLVALAIGTALAVAFEFGARSLRAYFLDQAGKKADLVLASTLFAQALGLKLAARPASSGAFASQLREFEALRDFMTSATLTAVMDLPFVVFFIWVIAMIGGPLYQVPLLAVPIVVVVGLVAQLPLAYLLRANLEEAAQRHGLLVESIEGMETLKALNAEPLVQSRFEHYSALTSRTASRARSISALVVNFSMLAQQLTTILIVVWGVHLIGDGALTVGALIACVILSGRALAPLHQVAGLMTRYQHARAAYRTLDGLMKRPVERPRGQRFLAREQIRGGIELEAVGFAYPEQERQVLNDVSLRIAPGEHVAVLGRIGSGKSTLLRLLNGLYAAGDGAVRIDGVELGQYDPADLRRASALVEQDLRLFQGSVRDNVTLGMRHATDDAILEAARVAGLDRTVDHLPNGFETAVGERGHRLSGGQRQAVALARAVLRQPSILLLDEPTSALDHSAEQQFVARMKPFCEGRTLVLVTHKPNLLVLVDRVVVMDAGRLVMDGPRDEILKKLMQSSGS